MPTLSIPQFRRTLVLDASLLTAACLIPAASHLTPFPLYQLNPMLILLVVGLGLSSQLPSRSRMLHGVLLACLLPLVSALVVGMPTPAKALCMAAELSTTALLVNLLPTTNRLLSRAGIVLLALLAAKGVYYLLKALLIGSVALVSTPIALQLLTLLAATILFLSLSRQS